MSTRSGSSDVERASARTRGARSTRARVNRSQVRAMEVRAAESAAARAAALDAPVVTGATESRRSPIAARRVIARPVALTRVQEYRFIRSDLRRLLSISAVLLVLMIALLLIVES